jgi:undecaprenyl-diphosphatase
VDLNLYIQAIVLGIVQGLTEFLPISSSGHLILTPYLAGWDDEFINSLQFSVMLHLGTLTALLVYFWRDWLRLVPAGLAAIRDRSLAGDPDRRLAWLLAVTVVPAAVAGVLLDDIIESTLRTPGVVATLLVVGAAVMWLADRWGAKTRHEGDLGFPGAFGVGVAQALALAPGVSRSGITISAGLFLGLTREAAARFAFLMATPIIAAAGLFEVRKLLAGDTPVDVQVGPLVAGMAAALLSGLFAIGFLLRYLRTRSLAVFIAYRLVLAAVIVIAFLNP